MGRYHFLTTWCVEAPAERVWDAIYDAERSPEWWRGVVQATKLRDGDENDIDLIMRNGAEGLARLLGARLVAAG